MAEQCHKASDKQYCQEREEDFRIYFFGPAPSPPAVVQFVPGGRTYSSGIFAGCPETHFQCPNNGYCLPVFVRCNDVFDCPGHEDEEGCETYTCPGFYHCRASTICLHPNHLCDGSSQCPQHDDELYCAIPACPDGCTCYGHSLFCTRPFSVDTFPNLRFLEAAGSGMRPTDVQGNVMLVYLSLAHCTLTDHGTLTLPNLRFLYLHDNNIQEVRWKDLSLLKNLRVLSLAGNPVTSLFHADVAAACTLSSLLTLDLSGVALPALNLSVLSFMTNLQYLNLSGTGLDFVAGDSVHGLRMVRVLDVRGCPVTVFPPDTLSNLQHLHTVYADHYRLCCPQTLPDGFNLYNCHAPSDTFSSCHGLLHSDTIRVFLSTVAVLAVAGNLGMLVYRVLLRRSWANTTSDVFITHLQASDLLMGVYCAVICMKDMLYLGHYYLHDVEWRHSRLCSLVGFLSFLSMQVSAFLLAFLTLHRSLQLCRPGARFRTKFAHITSGLAWTVGVVLASIPLLLSHWQVYSNSGICAPIPNIDTKRSAAALPGQSYAFAVCVLLHLAVFSVTSVNKLFVLGSPCLHMVPEMLNPLNRRAPATQSCGGRSTVKRVKPQTHNSRQDDTPPSGEQSCDQAVSGTGEADTQLPFVSLDTKLSAESHDMQRSSVSHETEVSSYSSNTQLLSESRDAQLSTESRDAQLSSEFRDAQISPESRDPHLSSESRDTQPQSETWDAQPPAQPRRTQVSETRSTQHSSVSRNAQLSQSPDTHSFVPHSQSETSRDETIAKMASSVVMTNILCAFLRDLCVMESGVMSTDVSSIVAVVIPPLCSALSPLLYAWGAIQQRQCQELEERIQKYLLAQLQARKCQKRGTDNTQTNK